MPLKHAGNILQELVKLWQLYHSNSLEVRTNFNMALVKNKLIAWNTVNMIAHLFNFILII